MESQPAIPPFRRCSLQEIDAMKSPSKAEWARIAREFFEWRDTITVPLFRAMGRDDAWNYYYNGYEGGLREGVNRALGMDQAKGAEIEALTAFAKGETMP